IGSARSDAGSKTAWLERGASLRAALPRATRSATVKRETAPVVSLAVAIDRPYPLAPGRDNGSPDRRPRGVRIHDRLDPRRGRWNHARPIQGRRVRLHRGGFIRVEATMRTLVRGQPRAPERAI